MNCEELAFRLYDEDCRSAVLSSAPLPEDVADHLAACSACRALWDEAAEDAVGLSSELTLEPDPHLRAELLAIALAPPQLLPWLDGDAALTILLPATLGAALSALLWNPGPCYQGAGFACGALAGVLTVLLDGSDLLEPPAWSQLRELACQGLELVRQA